MTIEAMKQALEALEGLIKRTSGQAIYSFMETERRIAIAACVGLRQAIEQAEKQEPVPWKGCDLDGMVEAFDRVIEAHFFRKNPFHNPIDADAQMALRILRGFIPYMKQYTTPQPQREWVGLTDEEMLMIYGQQHEGKKYSLGRMVEQALKEKNT